MSNQLGVAVFGCGYWGVNYVRVFQELTNSHVVSICEQRPKRLEEIGGRFPDVTLTPSAEEALGLDGIDVAIICTQATAHYDITRRCLEAGKHVLVEKPITTDVAEAEKLVALAESRGLILMVGHTFLYNPGIRKVREYVEKDEVGRLYYLYASRTNLGPFRHDVNALWDLATHDVSIFNYLLNATPLWVSAVGSNVLGNEHKDVGFVSISYPNNIIGHIHVSWAEPNKVRELVLVGSEKRVVFNDLDAVERVRVFEKGVEPTPEEADSFGEYQFLIRDGDIISPRVPVNEPLKAQCSHFLDCVTEQQQPFTDGRQGVEVVRVMEAIDRSIQNRGIPVEIYREKTAT